MSQTLENVILFARAGFRGINDPGQVETIMNSVLETLDGQELLVDGDAVGTISNARVEGSLIRGDVEIADESFLGSDAGMNLCRRIGAHVEIEAKPAKKATKTAPKKAVKKAEPAEEESAEEDEPVKETKTAPKKAVAKPTAKPAPKAPTGKGGKAITPISKGKIKVSL